MKTLLNILGFRRIISILSLLFICSSLLGATTSYYVDPDWAGTQSGTSSQPWASMTVARWVTVSSSLTSGDVTLYLSALKANGITQQSKAWYFEIERSHANTNRLTVDGHSFYNSSLSTPAWLANPQSDIAVAYTNSQVFKLTGDGSDALGWQRGRAISDFVTNSASTAIYQCIRTHTATAGTEPGVGASWTNYWDAHGVGPVNQWTNSTNYKCWTKQDNITIRGFECTGISARTVVNGDNLILQYVNIHDISGQGPGLDFSYSSHPDTFSSLTISDRNTNVFIHNVRVVKTFGEGFYVGAINPNSTTNFQYLGGNRIDGITISNVFISHAGYYGSQGDALDFKDGILGIKVVDCEFDAFDGNGINLPLNTFNFNSSNIIERSSFHDGIQSGEGGQVCIKGTTDSGTQASLYGIVGLTIRNNIFYRSNSGLQLNGSSGGGGNHPIIDVGIYNNTFYHITNSGISVSTLVTNIFVTNNFVFNINDSATVIMSSNVVSDYNVHDGTWFRTGGGVEGSHTFAITKAAALASVVSTNTPDLHLVGGTALRNAGFTLTSFSNDKDQLVRPQAGMVPSWDIGAYENASVYYAATNGISSNTGAIGSPWDLYTAGHKTNILGAGDILYLRDGTYTNAPSGYVTNTNPGWIFEFLISGGYTNPIIIMPYTNETVVIDGGAYGGQYGYHSQNDAPGARPTVKFGQPPSLNTAFGRFLTLRDVEIKSSSTEVRWTLDDVSFPTNLNRGDGIYFYGASNSLINCYVHDMTAGFSAWGSSGGTLSYGNIIYNNGWGSVHAHGHNMYLQNFDTSTNKYISTNILVNPYEMNYQAYGSGAAEACHFRISGNVALNNACLIGGKDSVLMKDDQVIGNYLYKATQQFAYVLNTSSTNYFDLLMNSNYLVDGWFEGGGWQTLTATNNTVVDVSGLKIVDYQGVPNGNILTNWMFDRNTYYAPSTPGTYFADEGVGFYSFANWKPHTTYESNSTFTTTFPTTNYIIIQTNIFDANRANLIIYNHISTNDVSVNVSGSTGWGTGDRIRIRSAQDPLVDIITNTLSGGLSSFDMRAASHSLAIPTGTNSALVSITFPAFGVYVIEKLSALTLTTNSMLKFGGKLTIGGKISK